MVGYTCMAKLTGSVVKGLKVGAQQTDILTDKTEGITTPYLRYSLVKI